MQEQEIIHFEKDKIQAPFLLAASFVGLIDYLGSDESTGVLHWKFAPKNKADELLDQLRTKRDPYIPARDLFDAIETWLKQIAKMRNGEMKYGKQHKY